MSNICPKEFTITIDSIDLIGGLTTPDHMAYYPGTGIGNELLFVECDTLFRAWSIDPRVGSILEINWTDTFIRLAQSSIAYFASTGLVYFDSTRKVIGWNPVTQNFDFSVAKANNGGAEIAISNSGLLFTSDQVTTVVINVNTSAIVATPSARRSFAYNPSTDRMWGVGDGTTIGVFNGSTGALVTTIASGITPRFIVYDSANDRFLLYQNASSVVPVFNGTTGALVTNLAATVPGSPDNSSRLYFRAQDHITYFKQGDLAGLGNQIIRVNMDTPAYLSNLTNANFSQVRGMANFDVNNRLWVANRDTGTIAKAV